MYGINRSDDIDDDVCIDALCCYSKYVCINGKSHRTNDEVLTESCISMHVYYVNNKNSS